MLVLSQTSAPVLPAHGVERWVRGGVSVGGCGWEAEQKEEWKEGKEDVSLVLSGVSHCGSELCGEGRGGGERMGPRKGGEGLEILPISLKRKQEGDGPDAARFDGSRGSAACSAAGTAPVGKLGKVGAGEGGGGVH
jgi:hypothetical protein